MTNKTLNAKTPSESLADATPVSVEERVEETPFEAVASICSVLVVGLFILTFLAQNFVIPSGSMENTLLVGDHLVVDRITLAPPAAWMPLVHYREPKRGDIIVFLKPVADADPVDGSPTYPFLVKRLVGIPGDHIHLRDGVIILNGVAQAQLHAQPTTPENRTEFLDEFPSVPPYPQPGATPESWAVDFSNHIENGDLVIRPGHYFMMGDNRHNSLDSRYGVLCRGKTLWAGHCSTTGRSRRQKTNMRNRELATVWPGWDTWCCTSSAIRAGRGRCI